MDQVELRSVQSDPWREFELGLTPSIVYFNLAGLGKDAETDVYCINNKIIK